MKTRDKGYETPAKENHSLLNVTNAPISIKPVYERVFDTLNKRCFKKGRIGMISFPDAFLCMSWMRIGKPEARFIMREMHALGMIEIHPYRGIVLRK